MLFKEHGIKECCGVFGVYGLNEAAIKTYYGLYSLQHRGQESAGIVVSNGKSLRSQKGFGLLFQAITPDDLRGLDGHIAVGHVRYSTTGAKRIQNIQPLVIGYSRGIVAIAHNGNLTNARMLRKIYENKGSIFQTSTDSEIFVHLLADPSYHVAPDPLSMALQPVQGSYALILMTLNELIAVRDPFGFRPLCIGKLDNGFIVASETCAFDLLGAQYLREVKPGEIVTFNEKGMNSRSFVPKKHKRAHCIFEHIYFARPDSIIFGETVHTVRERLGHNLAKESPVKADVVVAIPDSGLSAAHGYANASGIPINRGFIRNHYVGRTFIMPAEDGRSKRVEIKLNVVKDIIKDKRVVVIDDSIVRGNTSKARLCLLRKAGARELHFRVASPPIRHPCFFGIDFPHSDQLIASKKSIKEI
ncbi:MAG: amidophosphoribosyltransferase, partial [Elusimicrobiota bacterium]